jgi:hypothetical protein
MMLLYSVPWPPQGIYSKKPLATAADLKGIKWRAYSPATARIGELVGAQPVTVQAAEVSQAFATGVVESMMSSGSTGWDAKLHEHMKYWYDTQAWLPKNAIIVNKGAFDALDAATKAAVLKAAADAEVAWLGRQPEGQRRDAGQAQGRRHADPAAERCAQGRHEEGRRHHAEGMAGQGRPRRQAARRRLLEVGRPCGAPSMPSTTGPPGWRPCS